MQVLTGKGGVKIKESGLHEEEHRETAQASHCVGGHKTTERAGAARRRGFVTDLSKAFKRSRGTSLKHDKQMGTD